MEEEFMKPLKKVLDAGKLRASWGFRDEEFLLEHGATQIIHKPEELLEFF